MIDSKILVSVVIVLLIGVAAAGYQISNQTPGLWQPVTSTNPDTSQQASSVAGSDSGNQQSSASSVSTSTSQKTSASGSETVKISTSEAKTIAQKYILQDGATAGTPKLITSDGKKIYLVPVLMNGNQVGEIYIDPETGANLGGAGGAP
ncbi:MULTISPECIES: PepSY domain-containing protein [Methanobacterium]|jgi:uncharacterized membrane protein YkoI|uniref:PepSY domain-containing protein n=1 Tax=Methanobacterium subterraneum TaxID=59277 RepID=A0A2H4VRM6_9EURY|nr:MULTISPECIES: PepSY domain-containing protein [Methanobacterium]MBW4256184.1 PepSY domain-containing protein [Methanobacterium sp. YSL]PKL71952.1 MAG: peptidase propeptide domain-containing protein [Methanobacteriales archaeon HGW-Methanobacteriales-2]AUB55401.1 peptidase propeptide domain-containing protein [Methanobacterium subterraneum]AUB57624.1 peptidase propeptide domain-containing protein [Methanobacterium sp. MZ-A1]AUB60751.1 peptidase propeptide domain-containing protein [Methanoba